MEKSTGFSQSAYGLIQFMGKRGRKHPHILYMCTDAHTHRRTHLCLCMSTLPASRCTRRPKHSCFQLFCCFNQDQAAHSHGHFRACAHVRACAGNICAFWGPTHPPQQRSHEQGSSMCQHGASLTLGVLLKVLMEGALRRLCPLEPSCVSASPPLAVLCLFSLLWLCGLDSEGLAGPPRWIIWAATLPWVGLLRLLRHWVQLQ